MSPSHRCARVVPARTRLAVALLLPALLLASTTDTATAAGHDPELLFGMGPTADGAIGSELVRDAPVNMLTTWFNGTRDLHWHRYWQDGFIDGLYADGYAQHLIIFDETSTMGALDTVDGPACGRAWPVSSQFRDDMEELADIWVGDGPLYVTFFSEFQTYACTHNQWAGQENYYNALKDSFRDGAAAFRERAAERDSQVLVSFGPWGGWQHQWDAPNDGGGRSMIPYFADVMHESDFQSFQSMESLSGSNPTLMLEMTRLLAPYGPVMMAHYKPDTPSETVWDDDIAAIFTDEHMHELTAAGLFAFSFMDPVLIESARRAAPSVAGVTDYAANWLVPPALSNTPDTPTDPQPEPDPTPERRPLFLDVAADSPHRANVLLLHELGALRGFPDGTYRPKVALTRGQMASVLARSMQLPAGSADLEMSDVPPSHTHAQGIGAVAAAGIALGYPDGTFRPDQPVQRDQLASFLARAHGLHPGEPEFSDVTADSVHGGNIGALQAAGIALGNGGAYHPGRSVQRDQAASLVARSVTPSDPADERLR